MKRLKLPILIVIVLCCALSALGAILSPSKPATTPAAATTAAPAATKPEATATKAEGLETATVASPTEAPTDEPAPTAAATRATTATKAEQAFIDSIVGSETYLADELGTFGKLMTAAGNDSSKIKDPEWITAIGMQTALVEFRCEEILKIKSPSKRFDPGVAKIHTGANMLIKAMKASVLGVDNKDAAKLGEAITLMVDGNKSMKDGFELLTAVIQPKP